MELKLRPYLLLGVIGLFLTYTGPKLWSDGMFMDGLFYATIARNMAEGLGSFWKPFFSEGLFSSFYEHPPLAMGIQSIGFKIFGDSLLVERVYSLLTFLVSGGLIALLWKHIKGTWAYLWLPLFLWVSVEDISWACANNMLENTMTVFILFAAWLYMRIGWKSYFMSFICGTILALAFLSKGPISLYLLSLPFFHFVFLKRGTWGGMMFRTTLMIGGIIVPIAALMLFNEAAAHQLTNYFQKQIMGSLQHANTVDSRTYVLTGFIQQILIPLSFSIIVLIWGFVKKKSMVKSVFRKNRSWFSFFMALSFSGILPIMISMKQSVYYILSVYPFLALGFAILIQPILQKGLTKIKHWISPAVIKTLSVGLAIAAIAVAIYFSGRIGRDYEKLTDSREIIKKVGTYRSISYNPGLRTHYNLMGYLMREGHISLLNPENKKLTFYLGKKAEKKVEGYRIFNPSLHLYTLFKKTGTSGQTENKEGS